MTLFAIRHDEQSLGRAVTSYINCDDVLDVSENYDKNGRVSQSSSKLLLRSGKTYIVLESPAVLAARIAQVCPSCSGQQQVAQGEQGLQGPEGPAGPSTYILSSSVEATDENVVTRLVGAVFLKAGTLSTESSAYVGSARLGASGQTALSADRNGSIVGGVVSIVGSDGAGGDRVFGFFTQTVGVELLSVGFEPIANTSSAGSRVILEDQWCLVYVSAQGSEGTSDKGDPLINGCRTTILGLNLVYE